MPSVAIVGASADPSKWGYKSVVAHRRAGWDVYPVNPSESEIAGLQVYASIGDVPGTLDRISVYLRPAILLGVLDDLAAKGCRELWLNPGTDSPEVVARAEELGLNPVTACSIVDVAG